METIIILVFVIILVFGGVVVVGAPYLPTLNKQAEDALDLLDLNKGQVMLELGSGDGKVLLVAAKRGIYSVGYEINPILVILTKIRSWRYRELISVKWQNYWNADWPNSDGMYVFLTQRYMNKLNKKVMQYNNKTIPYKLVCNAYVIPNKKPNATKTGLSLYIYHK
jgi:hypothetical protein